MSWAGIRPVVRTLFSSNKTLTASSSMPSTMPFSWHQILGKTQFSSASSSYSSASSPLSPSSSRFFTSSSASYASSSSSPPSSSSSSPSSSSSTEIESLEDLESLLNTPSAGGKRDEGKINDALRLEYDFFKFNGQLVRKTRFVCVQTG